MRAKVGHQQHPPGVLVVANADVTIEPAGATFTRPETPRRAYRRSTTHLGSMQNVNGGGTVNVQMKIDDGGK